MLEPLDLEINDLIEDDDNEDVRERGNADVSEQEEDQEGEGAAASSKKKRKTEDSTGTTKRVVRNPQPKLNHERLCGDRGIAQLPKIFSEVKIKGKGHEKEDLDRVMKVLEHWAYRLFPKFAFDDVLESIEKLGSKKQVQTYLKKVRLDMVSVSDEFVVSDRDEEDGDHPQEESHIQATDVSHSPTSANDVTFDRLVASPSPLTTAPTAVISEETTETQKVRMERNRRLALERRAARMAASRAAASGEQCSSTLKPDRENVITDEEPISALQEVGSIISDAIGERTEFRDARKLRTKLL